MVDEAHFLDEVAAFLDAQEPLPLALWDSLSIYSVAELLLVDPTPDAAQPLLRESPAWQGSGEPNERYSHDRTELLAGSRPVKSRNTSREKLQSELKQLRMQSQELQCQLAALSTTPPASVQHELLLRATWEQVAKRQLELRVRAEAENARLRAQLEAQAAVLRSLYAASSLPAECVYHNEQHSTFGPLSAVYAPPTASPSAEDVQICKQLLAELDDVWLQMDDVLKENGLHPLQVTSSLPPQARLKSRKCPSGSQQTDSLYIELIETELLPFERDLVFSVMWECWARHGASKNCILLEYKPGEVIAATTRVVTRFNDKDVSLDFIHVAKVFRDQDRVCYVWRGITKADAHFPGVFVDEVGWQIMKPHSLGADAVEVCVRGTEILTCWQLESKSHSCGGDNDRLETRRVSPLTHLVISTAEADMLEVNNKMLSMLLEDATNSPSLDHHDGHHQATV